MPGCLGSNALQFASCWSPSTGTEAPSARALPTDNTRPPSRDPALELSRRLIKTWGMMNVQQLTYSSHILHEAGRILMGLSSSQPQPKDVKG